MRLAARPEIGGVSMRIRTLCCPACLLTLLAAPLVSSHLAASDLENSAKEKPSLSLRASPTSGFAPMRTVLTAELKGGADDYEEYYCPTVEWEITVSELPSRLDPMGRMGGGMGDSRPVQKSEQKLDCDPYEAGKSEIKRRFVREHTFKTGGEYTVRFSLKQGKKTVASHRTTVRVRGGVMDGVGR